MEENVAVRKSENETGLWRKLEGKNERVCKD
jgi:hypothetical protein